MEQLKSKNIVFCFPYKGVGGVSILFLRVSDYLQKICDSKIYLIDYKDGYMARHNQNKNINLLEYSDDKMLEIPTNSIAIFQTMPPWSIFPNIKFKTDTKLFFWNCHPFNLVPLLPVIRNWIARYPKLVWLTHKTILRPYNNILKRFYALLIKTHSIAFMDIDNLNMTEYILGKQSYDDTFLPIPLDVPYTNQWLDRNKESKSNVPLNCGWIGRVADFKYSILNRTLIELKRLAKEQRLPIHFKLIGDGEYFCKVEQVLKPTEYFTYEWIKEITPNELDQYILNNVDLLFSMGTSALEAAKLGVPTVLLDFSYGPVNEKYKFRYIYETIGYSLGQIITGKTCTEKNSIDKAIFNMTSHPSLISEKCYKYVLENHNLKNVTDHLINKLDQSTLSYDSLIQKGFFKTNFIYTAFKYLKSHLRSV